MLRYKAYIAAVGIAMPYTVMQAVSVTGKCRSHSVNLISN